MKTAKILVQGIVQGVGFRPNVYRIANKLNIVGYIRNLGNIVEIIAQGDENSLKLFINKLSEEKPSVSKINSIRTEWINCKEYNDFKILKSSINFSGTSIIPPDLSICDNCLKELRNKSNRRYNYPFIACTDCGPRFTVIKSVPYDRSRTTMDKFPLCDECVEEYTNPNDRRYHAEASCCDICGPSLQLYSKNSTKVDSLNPIKKAVELLDKGNILAMKGIGGTHLVAKVTENKPVSKLRKRLNRPNQPFACMISNISIGRTFAEISASEEKSLKSIERPIVVVKKSENYYFDKEVAPVLHNIGIILPYSPIHYLLFDYSNEPGYIMTSANIPGEPMMIENHEILSNLGEIADYFLLHDRKIINRTDDSVIRYVNDKLSFIRRSRGYAPAPYNISKYSKDLNILALGPELDVTFSILKEGMAYVSQHIGNTNKFKTYEFLQKAINHLMKITSTNHYDLIACDMHPQFFTSKLAKSLGKKFKCDVLPVQHHHAHGAVLGYDNNVDEFVYIAADGVGYGEDGTAWGGEILYTDIESYQRLGSLEPQKLPGGDISTIYPARMLASILSNEYEIDELGSILYENYAKYFKYGKTEINNVFKQLETNLNVSITSSTGRVLDSISTALDICGKRTYEGECSMKLESIAHKSTNNPIAINYEINKKGKIPTLNTSKILKNIIELVQKGENRKDIAKGAQITISRGLAELAIDAANKKGVNVIGGTGGVFYNEAISSAIKKEVEKKGFKFIQHNNSCTGDGSVSLGQAIVASKTLN
jgi:hydrogenase maturation protein HypF